jgi:hypothetical protein
MQCSRCLPSFSFKDKEDETFRNIVFSSNVRQLTKSLNPLIPSSKYYCQKHLKLFCREEYDMLAHNDKVGKIAFGDII